MDILQKAYSLAVAVDPGALPQSSGSSNDVNAVLSIVFVIIGGLAVLMIAVSGLRYITSAGDPQKASQAKSGILYALIGLAIALAAEAIVSFVGRRL